MYAGLETNICCKHFTDVWPTYYSSSHNFTSPLDGCFWPQTVMNTFVCIYNALHYGPNGIHLADTFRSVCPGQHNWTIMITLTSMASAHPLCTIWVDLGLTNAFAFFCSVDNIIIGCHGSTPQWTQLPDKIHKCVMLLFVLCAFSVTCETSAFTMRSEHSKYISRHYTLCLSNLWWQ